MTGIWQVAAWFSLGSLFLQAGETLKSFTWIAPKVEQSAFSRDLGMLDSEREEYATNLAGLAVNGMVAAKSSPGSISDARRMLALALHLSPRNKRAVVANFQLSKGLVPEASATDYSPQVFARLLLARAQLLEKQGGGENQSLARLFLQLAAGMDPKNEDAVYASEVARLDHGEVDWSVITDGPDKKP